MRVTSRNYSDGFFSVDSTNGFLPVEAPLPRLPEKYGKLQSLLDNMPVKKRDGSDGYLSEEGRIMTEVSKLPNYHSQVQEETDKRLVAALFRAYAFASSAYLLEPSYREFLRSGNYGTALRVLPKNLAQPFDHVANVLQVFPWMDYSYAYSLGNYVKKEGDSFDWKNLDMAASFSGGPNECGFIMLHVDINQHSPTLISSIMDTIRGLESSKSDEVVDGLRGTYESMVQINARRKLMWQASDHHRYNDFRIFIMGIKGNEEIFGDGVIYEGVTEVPRQYRGQTGAQDTIIPVVDTFTGLDSYYPENNLTEYLMDLRQYRPKVFRDFLDDLKMDCENMFERLYEVGGCEGLIYLLHIVEQVYYFRNGHWQFVQKYIMKNTKYERATGGTPIIYWIPNQIEASLSYMNEIIEYLSGIENVFEKVSDGVWKLFLGVVEGFEDKTRLLKNQVNGLKDRGYDVDLIYDLNKEHHLEDLKQKF